MQREVNKSTTKGSGITESDNLCHKCYENKWKNVLINYDSPVKRRKDITDQGDPSSRSQTCFDKVPQMCVVCARPQTDGKRHKVHDIVSRWVDVVQSEIRQRLLKADECKFIHFAERNKFLSKSEIETCSRTKYIVCNLKLPP